MTKQKKLIKFYNKENISQLLREYLVLCLASLDEPIISLKSEKNPETFLASDMKNLLKTYLKVLPEKYQEMLK